jgi:hypothetical protein
MAGPLPSLDLTAVLCIKASLQIQLESASGSYCAWESMVELYSKMKLSRPRDDRVIALQSIAKEIRNALKRTPCHAKLKKGEGDFIAGLWRNDLSRGLLWEQVTGGNHERLFNFPTWSWASINTAVRWQPRRQKLTAESMELVLLVDVREGRRNITVTDVTSIPRDRLRLLDLHGSAASNEEDSAANDPRPGDRADRRNFAVLHLRGRLQAVLVGARFADHETFYMAADATRHNARATGGAAVGQRVVTLPGLRGKTRGWASIEHPAFQDHHAFNPTPLLFALLVSTLSGVHSGWSGQLGLGTGSYDVFNVLVLRNSDELFNGFERVGVGRLFGKEIGQGFKSAQERDFRLV